MRILHTSDIHIGSPMTARLTSSKIRERRRELLSNFTDLVTEAKRANAGAVIIAGDLFDSEKITKKARDTVIDAIASNPNLTFFYLKGNHEGDALLSYDGPMPRNLLIFGDDWTYFRADNVTVAGRSVCAPDMFEKLELPSDTKNIVVLHGELRERSAYPDVIGKADAAGHGIDYMALGHYHSYSSHTLDSRGVAVYPGTPEGRGFDEAFDCGYVLLDTSALPSHAFHSFAKRRLRIVSLPLEGLYTPSEMVDRADSLLRDIPRGDLVRLELSGEYAPELWKDTDALLRRFADRFYHFEVKDSSKIRIDPESYKNDKSFKGEFIRSVSADDSLDEDTKAKIIACGLYALMGENIYDA